MSVKRIPFDHSKLSYLRKKLTGYSVQEMEIPVIDELGATTCGYDRGYAVRVGSGEKTVCLAFLLVSTKGKAEYQEYLNAEKAAGKNDGVRDALNTLRRTISKYKV